MSDSIQTQSVVSLTPNMKEQLKYGLSESHLSQATKPFVLGAGLNQYSSGMVLGGGLHGAGFFDWIGDRINDVRGVVSKAVDFVAPIAETVGKVVNVIKTIRGGNNTTGGKAHRGKGFNNPLDGLK